MTTYTQPGRLSRLYPNWQWVPEEQPMATFLMA